MRKNDAQRFFASSVTRFLLQL